jgi:16S rRNA (cytidine1402-2'-O)-methyltransferase
MSPSQPRSGPTPIDPRARAQSGEAARAPGALWLVAVPIGNLEDITLRALRILRSVSLIACEDTRTTRQLLKLLDIPAPRLIACHEHNERSRADDLIDHLERGEDVALVSDAGTPSVSDPGYRVVTRVIEAGYAVTPLPGPCAAIAALSASGLPTDRFRFIGFLSAKASARRAQLEALRDARETLIFYESPHRLEAFLSDAATQLGAERRAVVGRELTKRYEEFRRGSLSGLATHPGVNRGEVVVIVEGQSDAERAEALDLDALVDAVLAQGLSPSASAKAISKQSHLTRKEAYDLLQSKR